MIVNARTRPRVKGNRLVAVQRSADGDTTTIATYAYDGKNRRVEKVIENCGPEASLGDGGDTTVHFYYSDQWQILETRNGSNQATRQWVWGTQYVDELVLMDVNGSPDSDKDCDPDTGGLEAATDRRYFYHQDRNWNVVAVSMCDDGEGTDAQIIERYAYTPYGEFVVLSGAPATTTYERGQVKLHSAIGNPFAHQGLPFDPEKLNHQNRWREYIAGLQRFAQRDPEGYADGSNTYAYEQHSPLAATDPTGLWTWCTGWVPNGLAGREVTGTRISNGNAVVCKWRICGDYNRCCYKGAGWLTTWSWTEHCHWCGPSIEVIMSTPPVGGTGPSLEWFCDNHYPDPLGAPVFGGPGSGVPAGLKPPSPSGSCP